MPLVVFDPEVSFGRLVLSGTGVPTEEIGDRFNAGETLDDLARDFRVDRKQIEEALRCELHVRRRRSRAHRGDGSYAEAAVHRHHLQGRTR
jgi:uncharacterized protein (DUF433 family)